MHDLDRLVSLKELDKSATLKIFQNYFGTDQVEILEDGEKNELGNNNDFYNSEIRKAQFNVKVNGEVKVINVVFKTQLDDGFHKLTGKLSFPFTKEVFWYSQASRDLGKLFPEING